MRKICAMPLISIVSPFGANSDSFGLPMPPSYRNSPHLVHRFRSALFAAPACALTMIAGGGPAHAAPCTFQPQGEGRVAGVIDARSFRLSDGREIKLAGIEPISRDTAKRTAALAAVIAGRDVTLAGEDDAPDRYGRQTAFVFIPGEEHPVQAMLLAQGEALAAADIADKGCASALLAAEAGARAAKKGIWADPSAIKNAESTGDILAGNGRFMLVEGRILSVRQAGATTYLNFGHNWTRDFAVTISRRMLPSLEAAGMAPKSLENRRIRVRGFIGTRTGPRIELLRPGQLELLN